MLMQKVKHMAVVLGYEKWMQHHNGITADNFLEWKKLSREKGTDRQTLSRTTCTWPSPNSFEVIRFC